MSWHHLQLCLRVQLVSQELRQRFAKGRGLRWRDEENPKFKPVVGWVTSTGTREPLSSKTLFVQEVIVCRHQSPRRQGKQRTGCLFCCVEPVKYQWSAINITFFLGWGGVSLFFVFPSAGCNKVLPAWPNLFYEEQFILLPLSSSHHRDRWKSWISKGSSDAHHVS